MHAADPGQAILISLIDRCGASMRGVCPPRNTLLP
jgi:hypothetical protein